MDRSLALVLVALLAVSGLAAGATIVTVDGPGDVTIRPASRETVRLSYIIRNPQQDAVDWFGDVRTPSGWSGTLNPTNGTVGGRDATAVGLALAPSEDADPGEATLTFTLFARNATAHQQVTRTIDLQPQSPPLVLGTFANPLPAPLDRLAGAVLLNVLAWAGVVAAVYLGLDRLVGRLGGTQRTSLRMRRLVRFPLVTFLALWGVIQTLRILPPTRPVIISLQVLETVRLVVGVWLGFRLFRAIIVYYRQQVAPYTQYELDEMVIPLMEKLGAAFFVAAAFLLLLRDLGVDVGVLLAAGGFASVIIGFAAQNTLSNFFSGINILLDQPFREGDDIQIETGEVCRVDKIGLRTTRLYHYRQHEMIVVPNNDLATKRVVNLIYPDERYRYSVEVGVAYGSDTDLVEDLLHRAADEHPEVLSDPQFMPMVFFDGFGESGLQYNVRFFITDVRERWRIAADIRKRIDDLFREHGITIPFPQRTHWFKSTLHHKEGEIPTPGQVPDPEDPPGDRGQVPDGDGPGDEPGPGDPDPDAAA